MGKEPRGLLNFMSKYFMIPFPANFYPADITYYMAFVSYIVQCYSAIYGMLFIFKDNIVILSFRKVMWSPTPASKVFFLPIMCRNSDKQWHEDCVCSGECVIHEHSRCVCVCICVCVCAHAHTRIVETC